MKATYCTAFMAGLLFSMSAPHSSVFAFETSGKDKSYVEISGVIYEGKNGSRFDEDEDSLVHPELDFDRDLNLDGDGDNFSGLIDYANHNWGVWAEGLQWEQEEFFNPPNGSLDFGSLNFASDNTKVTQQLNIYQGGPYLVTRFGDFGVTGVSVQQKLVIKKKDTATERLNLGLGGVRWRYRREFFSGFNVRLEAQAMAGTGGSTGYDALGELGYQCEVENDLTDYSDYIGVAVGYRKFEVEGDDGRGHLEVEIEGPYARLDLGTRF